MTDQILREVEEEVRKEQMKKLWDKYGIYLIGIAVLVVSVTAGFKGWEAWQVKRSAAIGDIYVEAIAAADDGRHSEAAELLDKVSTSGVGSYALVARLRKAALFAEQGDTDAAVAEFDAISGDSAIDQTLQDLAALRAAYILVDTAPYEVVKERAEEHANVNGTWRNFAREILGLSAFREGNKAVAREWLEAITADLQAPRNARGRAELLLTLLGAEEKPVETQ